MINTNAHKKWKEPFTKTDPQYLILRNYWNKWIADKGKKVMVGTTVGVKKSMHSILGIRDARDLNKNQGRTKKDDEISEEDDDFEYDSDPEYDTIHFSNWNTKNDIDKSTELRTVNVHSDDDDDKDNDDNGQYICTENKRKE